MSDPIHPEGIYVCVGCRRTYPEYVNGCVNEHPPPRGVRLLVPDPPECPICRGANPECGWRTS